MKLLIPRNFAAALLVIFMLSALPVSAQFLPVKSWKKQADGVTFQVVPGILRLQVWTPRIIRVTYSPTGSLPETQSLSVVARPQVVPWQLKTDAASVTVVTDQVQAQVNRKTGAVRFLDGKGAPILSEAPGGRSMTAVTLAGLKPEAAFQSEQRFVLPPGEGIYGLGQHQAGLMDYRHSVVTLEQTNREVAIPFLTSSRGYGVLWDNPAHAEVAVGEGPVVVLPSTQLFAADGAPGGLTGEYFQGENFETRIAVRADPQIDFNWTETPPPGLPHDHYSVRWTGSVQSTLAGNYKFVTAANDGVRLWIDDKKVIDDWNARPVQTDTAMVHFDANTRHKIRMEFFQNLSDSIIRLSWSVPFSASTLSWKSEAAEAIDYYFIDGPKLDTVIAAYRGLTGQAPMPPKWALGYWQSKERYSTQQEWLDIAEGYRSRHLPIDNLVQDWFYWDPAPWGSHQFDPKRYPDPAAALAELHNKYFMHLMISVWGKFAPGSANNPDPNYDAMAAKGYLYPASISDQPYYDPFSPGARALYWQLMRDQLFSKGVDAWWLDASEPELDMHGFRSVKTAAGLGARVLNGFPLLHTTGVYQGQRATAPNQRVFILTRSAYAGQQRNAAATWSGDITATWDVFAQQIPAGLNFCLSGIPYWTTDIGAFFVNYPGGADNPEYRELYTRWFEYGAFCPIFRSHGTSTPREMWRFGPETQKTLLKYDTLRYRLMPYLYSQAWQVTHSGGTLMRGLVMDFPADVTARESRDEFLFGPSILVCPVIKRGAVTRAVYLPSGTDWTDFWTGGTVHGGRTITAPAPIDTLPLYVRAGSIVPMGPYLQYTAEKPADPTELRVYPGANSAFTLYEDEGINYNYEKGRYAAIPLTWNEASQTLKIGARQGAFPGMLTRRTFRIVWVKASHGIGLAPVPSADKTVTYVGKALVIKRNF